MGEKEITIGQQKFLVHYIEDEKELASTVETTGEILKIFYYPKEGEYFSIGTVQKIIQENEAQIFLKLHEILKSSYYESIDFTTITCSWLISTTSHWYIDNHVSHIYIISHTD